MAGKTTKKSATMKKTRKQRLLAGGNPQIAMADGDVPVQAYIAAMPGWKSDVGRRVDALVTRTVPGVRKAVKWNSPFYGVEGQGWFLAIHTFARHVKLAFFRGSWLRPLPPGASKVKDTRYVDIREGDLIDEAQMATWIRQAAALPGWVIEKPKGTESIEEAAAAGAKGRGRGTADSASRLIDRRIRELSGWRGETLARMRALILEADPGITEEWKWSNPVWSHDGIVCTGEAYTKVVKLTFAHGAGVEDPSHLFNSSLGGNTRRAIDLHEGEGIDARAFRSLVKAAVARNVRLAKER